MVLMCLLDTKLTDLASAFSLPVTDSGKAGQSVCVLVHPRFQKAVSLCKLQPEASAVWVRFSASAFGLDKDLFMASVYIPPGGSQQLHESPVAARFQLLSDAALDALQHGYVSWVAI